MQHLVACQTQMFVPKHPRDPQCKGRCLVANKLSSAAKLPSGVDSGVVQPATVLPMVSTSDLIQPPPLALWMSSAMPMVANHLRSRKNW